MKKILFLDHTAKMSGGERSLLLILEKLDRRRFTPVLLTLEDGPLLGAARAIGVESECIPIPRMVADRKRAKTGFLFLLFSLLLLLPKAISVTAYARRKQVDIIYTNSQKAHLIGIGAGLIAGIPVFWHFRDILHERLLQRLMRCAGLLFTEHIIAISNAVAEQFMIGRRVYRKVSVVYNALDIYDFEHQAKETGVDLRREFGLPKGTRIIASVGQIAEWKGQEYLLKVAEKLVPRYDKLYFFIVGKSLFKEQAYLALLQEQVRELGLEERMFFTGFRSDIPAIMQDIDILIHTPVKPEPFGRVLVEAMVSNTPVVAFDIGAIPEIVDKQTGILVPPHDIAGLVQSAALLLDDDMLRNNMVKMAQSSARNRFDHPVLISKIESLLDAKEMRDLIPWEEKA
jgi:glycosyltransferase involved in cell wall biosynthesis